MDSNKTFTLALTGAELMTVGQALGDLPYKVVQPLLEKLNAQIAAQIAPAEPAPTAPAIN